MATAEFGAIGTLTVPIVNAPQQPDQGAALHRIREIRLREGVSLRSAARQTGKDVRTLRLQEQESTDLRISDLRRWQKALDVPLAELVVDDEMPLSRPVMERARMIRLMKTAAAIHERAPNLAIQRMAQMMVDQLVEIMPELREVSPWHQFGQRRSLDEYGRVMERVMSDDSLDHFGDED
ncbi:MAG: helix-turn-helix domain-containing protein [Pirellulaceae bacterium]